MVNVVCYRLDKIKWIAPKITTFTTGQNVHVWRGNVARFMKRREELLRYLSEEEQDRYKSYTHIEARDRFLASRGALRILLGDYLNIAPSELQFSADNIKKPILLTTSSPIHYNVAHSGDVVAIAVANTPVGVDVEKVDSQFDFADLLSIYFSPAETEYIKNATNARGAFYEFWTRKEALLKGTGKAVNSDLSGIPCLLGKNTVNSEIIGGAENWQVSTFDCSREYVGSVACNLAICQISFMEISEL